MTQKSPREGPDAKKKRDLREVRPFWARFRTLSPHPEATELAQRVLPVVMKLVEGRELRIKAAAHECDWVQEDLVGIADDYLRTRDWLNLPPAEFYGEHVSKISDAAEMLLTLIREAPAAQIWELAWRTQHELGMPFRQTTRTKEGVRFPPVGFEQTLFGFVELCKAISSTEARRAERPREDLVCLAAGLSDLWTKFSGKRFPKTLSVMRNKSGMADPTEKEFQSPGPEFVRVLMRAFDESVTFAQAGTAIKSMPVKPHAIQENSSSENERLDCHALPTDAEHE